MLNQRHVLAGLLASVALLCLFLVSSRGDEERPAYIGSDKCKMCHKKIHAACEESVHALANPDIEEARIEKEEEGEELDPTEDEVSYVYRRSLGFDGDGYADSGKEKR